MVLISMERHCTKLAMCTMNSDTLVEIISSQKRMKEGHITLIHTHGCVELLTQAAICQLHLEDLHHTL